MNSFMVTEGSSDRWVNKAENHRKGALICFNKNKLKESFKILRGLNVLYKNGLFTFMIHDFTKTNESI